MLDCLCRCGCSAAGWACAAAHVDCYHFPFVLTASPACSEPERGDCVCRGFGCDRAQPSLEGPCFAGCLLEPGTPTPATAPTPTTAIAPSPSPTGRSELDVFARGDTDCSIGPTSADVVAQVRALDGISVCANDDCDRDGDVDADDVMCAAGCLFGACPVPPLAPRITAVEAVSVPELRPFALVRLTGEQLGDAVPALGLRVGDRQGTIVARESERALLALLPDVEAGRRDLTLSRGEIAAAPLSVTVAPAQPVGDPDTIEGVVADMQGLMDDVLALDLPTLLDEQAALVVPALESKREELAAALAALLADPSFTPAFAARLDEALDASGTPELLRAARAGLSGVGGAAQGATILAGAAQAGQTVIAGGATIEAAVGAAAAAGGAEATAAAGAATLVGEAALVWGGVLVVGAGIVAAAVQETPVLLDLEPRTVAPGEAVTVTGLNLGGFLDFDADLVLRNDKGQEVIVRDTIGGGDGTLVFEIPDAVGVCGTLSAFLRIPVVDKESANVLRLAVRPVLRELARELVATPAEGSLTLFAGGVLDCATRTRLVFQADEGFQSRVETFELSRFDRTGVSYRLPPLVPGRFLVELSSNTLRAREQPTLFVEHSETDVEISCPTRLSLGGNDGVCRASGVGLVGGLVESFFAADPEGVVGLGQQTLDRVRVSPQRPGQVRITAERRRTDGGLDRLIVANDEGVTIEVVDDRPPTVQLARDTGTLVRPGDVIQVTATAVDEYSMQAITLAASGPVPADQRTQTFDGCNPLFPAVTARTCETVFTVDVVAAAGAPAIVLAATAVDAAGNRSDAAELIFELASGDIGGTVRDARTEAPIPGATIQLLDAGGQVVDAIVSGGGSFLFADVAAADYAVRAFAGGFVAATETVTLGAGEALDLTIRLAPLDGPGRLIVTAQRADPDDRSRVAGVAVAVLDRDLIPVTGGVTGDNGQVQLEGLPPGQYLWRADADGFAPILQRFDVNALGGLTGGTAELYPRNPSCSTDVGRFRVTQGRTVYGNQVQFFAVDPVEAFDDPPGRNRKLIHPDAAVACVSGNPARPTIGWHVPWANALVQDPPVNVLRFTAQRIVIGNTSTLFNLVAEGEIVPPVAYGDASQGRDAGPFGDSTPPDLEPDDPIVVTVGSFRVTLHFTVR